MVEHTIGRDAFFLEVDLLPKPRTPAPALSVDTVGGGHWSLADQETWTMIEFYRGLHCPGCQAYLRQMDREVGAFADIGVDVIAVSGDDRARAEQAVRDWNLEELMIGYGMSVETMGEWGLFISKGISDDEPELFSEPGLFVTKPDGSIYYVAVNSMTFARPRMSEMLKALEVKISQDAPARGEV
ncbi:MAG TPA: redoxin domain-containing protein [Acidimicrobiia bacterium]|nr:redoxin domain-containing protein [Acidimicrobiia bacterium]